MSELIVGAGLTGLLAAHAFPNAEVTEQEQPRAAHKALLRFRSDALSALTGIPFRKVTVRKGIYWRGSFHSPNIKLANLYAQKVTNVVNSRSIWDVEPATRWIAPADLWERLLDNVQARVTFGQAADFCTPGRKVINTAALPVVLRSCGLMEEFGVSEQTFRYASIMVARFQIPDVDVYQTIYFPDLGAGLYRMSISGDTVIAEFTPPSSSLFVPCGAQPSFTDDMAAELVSGLLAFGIYRGLDEWQNKEVVSQEFGKIVPLEATLRRRILHDLTARKGIWSCGRFGTWRNILLDDLVNDFALIKRMLRDDYEFKKAYHNIGEPK